jgi:predicted Zn-dependent peptidase
MKRINRIYPLIIIAIFAISNSGFVNAQTTEFEVDGLKVIYKKVPKEILSVRFFISGGTANYPIAKQGIENFAYNLAVTGGTATMNKMTYTTALEKIGTNIGAGATFDYGQFNMRCIDKYWDKSWDLFVDAIINPAFDQDQFTILKEQLIAAAKQQEADPDASLRNEVMTHVFEGKNYGKNPAGTEESLANISLDDIKSFYKNTVGKKRSFLVVIGNIDEKDLKKKISSSLAKLPEGTLPPTEERAMINDAGNSIVDRDIATNYIMGIMSAPTLDSDDGVAMMLAMSIMYDRYFIELRTNRGLSYAPAAFYSSTLIENPYNGIYITTTDPKQSIEVMVAEIDKLKKEGFTQKELDDKMQGFLTNYLMGQETLASQSNSLGISEMKGGWEMAENFTEEVNKVTLDDINRVIDKYSSQINWTYLGKEDMIEEEDFLQPGILTEELKVDK